MAKLITYDLRAPGRNYDGLIEAIKKYNNWGKATESCFVVVSDDSCASIRDNLAKHMDANDRLFVCKLSGEAAWKNIVGDNEKMKSRLNQ